MSWIDNLAQAFTGVGKYAKAITPVVGLYGAYRSYKDAETQRKYLNALMQVGQTERAEQEGIRQAVRAGTMPHELEMFADYFMDFKESANAEKRQVERDARKRMDIINDNFVGGAKVRALANLSMQVQEQKGDIDRRAIEAMREADLKLKEKLIDKSMTDTRGLTETEMTGIAQKAYAGSKEDIGTIAKYLGAMSGEEKEEKVEDETSMGTKRPTAITPKAPPKTMLKTDNPLDYYPGRY
uniref:Uncharacterized protein n=1 Tax=viral metagenome TaxID=1070528 RepID=A0A6M3KJ83_9ZZZZ